MAFTKLFSSIITSTIWTEDDQTRIVWITMLALADRNGEVQGSVPGLARLAGVPVDACRAALATFLAPDPDSRTKDDEGRRIEEIDGGWLLLNYAKYRQMASKEEQVQKATERTRRYRAKKARNGLSTLVSTVRDAKSTAVHDNPTEAEAEADKDMTAPIGAGAETEEGRHVRRAKPAGRLPEDWTPSIDLQRYASDLGCDADTASAFADYWHAENGSKAIKRDWDAAFRTWCRREAERRSGPRGNPGFRPAIGDGGDAGAFARAAAILGRNQPVRE